MLTSLGFVASAFKGIREFEASGNYVHDEQGVGIWFDHAESGRGNEPRCLLIPVRVRGYTITM